MKKWIIIILLMFVIPTVFADICEETIDPNKDCTMLTPVLVCDTYNYTITEETGSVVEQGNLNLLNGSIYYFTFNQDTGGYMVELCDSSTREISVKIDKMLIIALCVVAILFILGFAYDGVFIYAGSVVAVLFGLSLLTGVLADKMEYIIAMVLILIGIGYIYYDRHKKEKNEEAIRGDWL